MGKYRADLPDKLHRRLSIHGSVVDKPMNDVVVEILDEEIPEYEEALKEAPLGEDDEQ